MNIRNQYEQFYKPKAYEVPRYYQNTQKKGSNQINCKKKFPKRQTYIDEAIKQTKNFPGPNKYLPLNPEANMQKKSIKLNVEKQKKSYLDQVIKRSRSVPAIGNYNIEKNEYEKIKSKYAVLTKIQKQKSSKFKPSIFQSISSDLLNVGPGIYNYAQISTSPKYSIMPEHKKSKSLPKIPSPQEYNPVPSNYSTFDKISSISKLKDSIQNVSTFGSRKNIKNIVNSPGPIYGLICEWCPKKQDRNGFNLLKSISKGPQSYKSVYSK